MYIYMYCYSGEINFPLVWRNIRTWQLLFIIYLYNNAESHTKMSCQAALVYKYAQRGGSLVFRDLIVTVVRITNDSKFLTYCL